MSHDVDAWQTTPLLHALFPFPMPSPQTIWHVFEVHATASFAHAFWPVHPIAQLPASHTTPLLHVLSPLQRTEHAEPEHATASFTQVPAPTHRTSQAVAPRQSTPLLHEPSALQRTAHGMPGGHTTGAFRHSVAPHLNVHQPPSQTPPSQPASQLAGLASNEASSGTMSMIVLPESSGMASSAGPPSGREAPASEPPSSVPPSRSGSRAPTTVIPQPQPSATRTASRTPGSFTVRA